jgi:hypothetical protein
MPTNNPPLSRPQPRNISPQYRKLLQQTVSHETSTTRYTASTPQEKEKATGSAGWLATRARARARLKCSSKLREPQPARSLVVIQRWLLKQEIDKVWKDWTGRIVSKHKARHIMITCCCEQELLRDSTGARKPYLLDVDPAIPNLGVVRSCAVGACSCLLGIGKTWELTTRVEAEGSLPSFFGGDTIAVLAVDVDGCVGDLL